MTNYKKFYHLHTPWTGGRWLLQNVIYPLLPEIKSAGIEVFNDYPIDNPKAHGCWNPEIDDDTYVISTFRDPVYHLPSLFFHMKAAYPDQRFPNEVQWDPEKFTEELFFKALWDPTDGVMHYLTDNFQSKNLLYKNSLLDINNIRTYISPEHNFTGVLKRAERVDLLIRTKDLPKEDPTVLISKVGKDLGLTELSISKAINNYIVKLPYLDLLNKLQRVPVTKEFADKLIEEHKTPGMYTKIRTDMHIYSIDRLFYNPLE